MKKQRKKIVKKVLVWLKKLRPDNSDATSDLIDIIMIWHKESILNLLPKKKRVNANLSIGQDGFVKGFNACLEQIENNLTTE